MRPLVGADRHAIIDNLVAQFDAVASGRGPRAVSLEASLGLGKTRIAQELYARLATSRQGANPYWPPKLDWGETQSDDVLQARKQVEPTAGWVIPGGVEIPWLWWGIPCQLNHAGYPMRAMKDASDQLRVHLDPLLAKLQAADASKDDALEALSGVFDLVGIVNPGAALDAGSKFFGVWRRRRERSRQAGVASMDRRVEVQGESYAEAGRIADGLSAVARARTPVVLVVDDAQWADPALISLLRHLIRLEEAPVLIVTTAWPEKLAGQSLGPETFAGWLSSTGVDLAGRMDRIALDRLDDGTLGEIVVGFAPRTEPQTVERIAAIASGNPLVLNLLLDLDVIRRDVAADGRIDTDPATITRLPSNLRAIYQDLWGQLPDAERRVLALVAVQGPEFLPGFVEDAAVRLGMHDELVPAFATVRDDSGWIRPVNSDRYEFSERQRFDVADDVLREVFTEEAQATIRGAILAHILDLKASSRWPDLDLRTRRLALESHLDLNEQLGEGVERDRAALADSMEQLAALEVDAGDPIKAAELLASSGALRESLGEVVSATQIGVIAELTEEIEEAAAAPVPSVPLSVTADEWGRIPWLGWAPHEVAALAELPPSEVAELIGEVVTVEGPVYAGRVYRQLAAASGAGRQGRLIRAALDSGVRSSVRRGQLIATVPDARGASDRRILRLATQPEVILRQMGERTVEEIPPRELALLVQNVAAREPGLARDELKRRILPLVGMSTLSRRADELLERSLPAALGVEASAPSVATGLDKWGRAAWVGWSLHDVSTLAELSPREVADLITEVVAAEGPVVIGRAFDLLRQGSGAPRMSKSIRNALESGVGSGVRSGDLVVASGRRGEPDSRVLRLATQPEVMLRTPGDRDIWSIPGPELAELADRIREGEPAIERDALKRRVAQVLGWARYTAPLDKLLETAIPKVG